MLHWFCGSLTAEMGGENNEHEEREVNMWYVEVDGENQSGYEGHCLYIFLRVSCYTKEVLNVSFYHNYQRLCSLALRRLLHVSPIHLYHDTPFRPLVLGIEKSCEEAFWD